MTGAETIQVSSLQARLSLERSENILRDANGLARMLEDPTYAAVVRWGDEGDSFVVLEVGFSSDMIMFGRCLIWHVERKIHQVHPPKTLQT